MGSVFEFNDTLKLDSIVFPKNIKKGKCYEFEIKEIRIFHLFPVRVFLVEEVNGKWNYRGHIQILELKLDSLRNVTSGNFKVMKLYNAEYAKQVNQNEPPRGKEYITK